MISVIISSTVLRFWKMVHLQQFTYIRDVSFVPSNMTAWTLKFPPSQKNGYLGNCWIRRIRDWCMESNSISVDRGIKQKERKLLRHCTTCIDLVIRPFLFITSIYGKKIRFIFKELTQFKEGNVSIVNKMPEWLSSITRRDWSSGKISRITLLDSEEALVQIFSLLLPMFTSFGR